MNHIKKVSKAKLPAPSVLFPVMKLKPAHSDRRLKRKIATLRDALGKLLRLRGVTFEYNEAGQKRGCPAGARMGMIAQEVEEVVPEWVQVAQDGYRELSIDGFEALTVEALRELKTENDELREEIAELKALAHELREERRPVYAGA